MGLLSPPGIRENLLKEAERLREIAREMEAEDAGFEQSAM
jgi:hypothetical protein